MENEALQNPTTSPDEREPGQVAIGGTVYIKLAAYAPLMLPRQRPSPDPMPKSYGITE